MIFINPTTPQHGNKNILDDDNFWQWLHRELKAEWFFEQDISKKLLLNSSKKTLKSYPNTVINYHIELVIEIYNKYKNNNKLNPTHKQHFITASRDILENCKKSKTTVIPSKLMYTTYKDICSNLEVLPIGLNTDIWKPLSIDKKDLREKYQIPTNKKIGFWSGNDGVWRGSEDLKNFSAGKDIFWIISYYRGGPFFRPPQSKDFFRVDQKTLNELYNASDFYLCTNQLGPYYMSDWEAIASGVDIVDTVDIEREFGNNPTRDKMLEANWDRKDTKKIWEEFLNEVYNLYVNI